MKQTIIALIRPKLNFAQKESQAAHLIEHILVAPKRLEALGISDDFYVRNIICHNGVVNDFYVAEYFVVKSEVAREVVEIISRHQDDLFIDRDDYEKIKSVVIEEIAENRGEFIDIGEQVAKEIYQPGSPSIANPWNDLESIVDISFDDINRVFKKYNINQALFELSFDSFRFDNIPRTLKNELQKDAKIIELTHPWQSLGSVDTNIIIPFGKKLDPLINLLYCNSLNDFRFGLLFDEIRRKHGLVYDITVTADYNNNSMEIYFSSSEESVQKIIDLIEESLGKYSSFINDKLKHIKGRLELEIDLDWGDIQNQALGVIDDLVMGGFREAPIEILKKIETVSASDLCNFNLELLNQFQTDSILIKKRHGKKVVRLAEF